MPFEWWYGVLLIDADRYEKRRIVQSLGHYILTRLYEEGAPPTYAGLLAHCEHYGAAAA